MLASGKGITTYLPAIEYFIVNLVIALLVLVAGWALSSFAGGVVKRLAARSPRIDPTIVPMVQTVTIWGIRIFVVVAVLARFGVQTASIITVLGAAGLAVGLALQGTLQNIAAGIMLLALRPLRAGEYVSIVGKGEGTVQEVGLFLTRLEQYDGVHLSLPNSSVWGSTIINYSRNPARRLDLELEVSDPDRVEEALASLRTWIESVDGVLGQPAPAVEATGFNEGRAVITLRVWMDSERYWSQRFALYRQASQRLEALGIGVPVPLREARNPGPAHIKGL